jgi:diguanylate cyclase (GGDEF)-like protein
VAPADTSRIGPGGLPSGTRLQVQRWTPVAFVGLLGLHTCVTLFVQDDTLAWSYGCVLLVLGLTLALCGRRIALAVPHNKPLWRLLFCALATKAAAHVLLLLDALQNADGTLVMVDPSLYFCLSGLFMVAAAAYDPAGPLLRWATAADLLLSLVLAILFYVVLKAAIPAAAPELAAPFLTLLFDGLDAFVAIFATLRLFGTRRADERRFFSVLAVFGWADGLAAALHNRLLFVTESFLPEVLQSLSVALLGVLLARRASVWFRGYRPSARIRQLSRSIRPFILCIGLCIVALALVPVRPTLAITLLATGILIFAVRNALIVAYHLQVEDQLRSLRRSLQYTATHDELTGLVNRRGLFHMLRREYEASRNTTFTVAMIDVDHFKGYNDAYGHQAGDACLARVAHELRLACADVPGAVAGRYGGEEFLLALPAIPDERADRIVGSACARIAALGIPNIHGINGIVTVSAGVASTESDERPGIDRLISEADEAVYRAKAEGRGRLVRGRS